MCTLARLSTDSLQMLTLMVSLTFCYKSGPLPPFSTLLSTLCLGVAAPLVLLGRPHVPQTSVYALAQASFWATLTKPQVIRSITLILIPSAYGYIHHHAHVFPLKEMQLVGELASHDGSIDPNGWHQHAIFAAAAVADGQCAKFLAGKQIQFLLPVKAYLSYTSAWQVQAQHQVYSQCGLTGLEVQYIKYLGKPSDLHTQANSEFMTQSVLSTFLVSPAPADVSVPKGWYTTDVCSCLCKSFPTSRTLADIAAHSLSLAGTYPQPSALVEATKRQSEAYVQASTHDVPGPASQACESLRGSLAKL
jgi:hypothetical protein